MDPKILIGLLLLLQVVLDATGDAFRAKGWQLAHHLTEGIQIAGWFLIWALFGFGYIFIPIYILGRIWLFDLLFNIWKGNQLLYMGENDVLGKAVRWFADLVGHNYMNFSFIIKLLALVGWIGLMLK